MDIMLKVENIYKSFGATKALTDVTWELEKGQILGLIGENGSGKSTIASIIAGIQHADSGRFYLEGIPYSPKNTDEATGNGVCMILQESGTFDQLTVAQNVFIGKEKQFSVNKKMNATAQTALNNIFANHIKSNVPLGRLSFEDRKLVELARAMYEQPKVLIVDETTTALSKAGRDVLYKIISGMKEQGKSVIFISHDIEELIEVCDKLTILRDGEYVGSLIKNEYNEKAIKSMMVGRELSEHFYRTQTESSHNEDILLEVSGINAGNLENISFSLHKGEILGLGGLTDCGMHDLGKIIFGLLPAESGEVKTGRGISIDSPHVAMREHISYISKNRDQESLMVAATIKDNICIASLPQLKTGPFVFPKKEKTFVNKWSEQLNIKMQNMNQFAFELSGGNKQKVVMAKWLGFGADIFIMDCPTRGIDVGVKATIYGIMEGLRAQGKSIILISEELPEIIGMSDRIIILKNGRISGEFRREDCLTENDLIESII